MPYWIGRYNGLIREEGEGGDMTADELEEILRTQ